MCIRDRIRDGTNVKEPRSAIRILQHVAAGGVAGRNEDESTEAGAMSDGQSDRRRQTIRGGEGVEQNHTDRLPVTLTRRDLQRQIKRGGDDRRAVVRRIDGSANRSRPGKRGVGLEEHDALVRALAPVSYTHLTLP